MYISSDELISLYLSMVARAGVVVGQHHAGVERTDGGQTARLRPADVPAC